ncbi:MAG: tRNA sulfurtransferase [Halobacteriota archaeon]
MDTNEDVVVVGYGEIGTKSTKVRTRMERTLRDNVAAMLDARGVSGDVERRWSRLFVWTEDTEAAARAAADTMGVVWARPAISCSPTLDGVSGALRTLATDHGSETFAVRASRAGGDDAHPFTSRDLEREGGSVVQRETDAAVDLETPDRTYRIECRRDDAFVSVDSHPGPGGLPLGTQGTAVVLLSGGIDSPVAAWEMMRRGCEIAPVYVDLGDYGGVDHEARAIETARAVARFAPGREPHLRVVPAGDLVERLVEEVGSTRMLSLRRMMVHVAETVARRVGAHSVVTGESLGQKSSQTGENLAVTDAVATLPVHRPLLTRDKTDITATARRIGTFDDATLPVGCERVAPSHPETAATLRGVEAAEPGDLFERAVEAVERRRLVSLTDDGS